MAATADEKEQMKAKGVWDAYVQYRGYLKNTKGMTTGRAEGIAKKKYLYGDISAEEEAQAKEYSESIKSLPESSDPVELIRWVASNLGLDEPNMETCPGKDAKALLKDCNEDNGFRIDFWKSMFTKILPSRAQLSDGEEVGVVDGWMVIGVLEKIQKISERAKG